MFNIAICDDVMAVCDELKTIILDAKGYILCKEISINIFYSGDALVKDLKDGYRYDLIFLDIEFETEINGVMVGRIIREEMDDYITQIVYISSRGNYDRQLFDVQPLHFLQKPLEPQRVIHDINLAMKISEKENKLFEFKICRNIIKVPYKDILYFESMGRETKLVCHNEKFIFYDNIYNIHNKLPDFFIVPHRSYIVNYGFIKCFKVDELVISNGDILPISRNRRNEIREKQALFERKRI